MEHLPTLARLFSVTMDDLIGYGDENQKLSNHEMEKKFRQTLIGGDVNEIVSLMRLLRYEYLDEFDQIYSALFYTAVAKLAGSPEFMEELRLLVGEYLKHGDKTWTKQNLIEIMIQLEDDEHFEHLLKEHSIPADYDMSINGILMRRATAKKDDETYRLTRAVRKMRDLYSYLARDRWDFAWNGVISENSEDDLSDIPALDPVFCAGQSRRKLEMLHNFNAVVPDEKHPVSGDGELDLWGIVRVEIGIFYAAQLSACGNHDLALTVLEDCASLIEQLYDFPGGTEQYMKCEKHNYPKLTCKSPELAGITAIRQPVFLAGMDLPPDVGISYRPEREFRHINAPFERYDLGMLSGWQYPCLTYPNILWEGFRSSWFDPICEHPRYLAVVERIRKSEKGE